MNLNDIPIFAALQKRMAWLSARHDVLAQNVANADTPNYRPKDLVEPSFAELVKGPETGKVTLRATQAGHIPGGGAGHDFGTGAVSSGYETAPSGNSVVLEEQLIKVAETQAEHQLSANLYRKHVEMIRIALGRRG
ncbi:flagellar basal body protein [Oceanibacterium hippocampi]|uniref:Flagellar basal body rod protein FlgB n=1 Tax=Oceanibacterium hippocampi TaxID=745714 RepID=A0A1Y5TY89_9PROT|nr:flagellar basal body protein [Oceanibacterium hippocampi]SLN76821.1 Flagellar basal body rod protein FlgB [Oceanibacterium hippocampi]